MGNRICRARRNAVEERFTRPQRLVRQPSNVDYKKLRKLIVSQKLAPCFDGVEDSTPNSDLEECPICFFFYPSLNRSRCCAKGICTECFLQMNPSNAVRPAQCPFCKTSSYAVEYRGAKTKEEKGLEQAEEQKVLEAKLRIRFEESQNADCVMLPTLNPSRAEIQSPTESSEEQPNGSDQDIRDSDPSVNDGDTEVESTFLNAWNERHAEFGLDLEEIMVMEAIWQSIQNPQQSSETNDRSWCRRETFGSNQSISYRTITNQDICPSVSITGGVAVAIARLAERNILHSEIARSTQEDDQASQTHAENSVENYDSMTGTITHDANMHQMRLVRPREDCEFHEERSEHDCLASCSTTEDDSVDSLSAYVPEENHCLEDGFTSEDNPLMEVMDNASSFSSVHTISDVSCGSPNSYAHYSSQNISLLQGPIAAVRHQRVCPTQFMT